MIPGMKPLHISEGDLARDARSILKRVETGGEVIVERDAQPVAVIRTAEPVRRKISECIALMPAGSTATMETLGCDRSRMSGSGVWATPTLPTRSTASTRTRKRGGATAGSCQA